MNRTKNQTLAEIDLIIQEIRLVQGDGFKSARATSWLLRTGQPLEDVFGRESLLFANFGTISWGAFQGPVEVNLFEGVEATIERVSKGRFIEQMNQQREYFLRLKTSFNATGSRKCTEEKTPHQRQARYSRS